MRKWAVPLAVVGLGGVGALLLSERGRRALGWAMDRMQEAPDRIADLNDRAQSELDKIQSALNDIAASLQPKPVR